MLGSQGPDVGRMQQMLIEAGFRLDSIELEQEKFGPSTADAVRMVQQKNGLRVDAIVGPQTASALRYPITERTVNTVAGWRCRPSQARQAVRAVLSAAVDDLGTAEDPPGSNAGPGLVKYTGHTPGLPWCAFWVSWALSHADGGCPWGVLGSAFKILDWARKHGRVLGPHDSPLEGDVWLRMRTQFAGHVALIVDAGADGTLATIEGNSGDRVRGLLRYREDATAVVRAVPV